MARPHGRRDRPLDSDEEEWMRGTIVCAVTDTDAGREALDLAAELSRRLALRLVVAHVADPASGSRNGEAADRLVARLVRERGLHAAEPRSGVGDPATVLGQIAAEEAADVIVVGARPRGRLRRGLESTLAPRLEAATHVPVVIAPPRLRASATSAAHGDRG